MDKTNRYIYMFPSFQGYLEKARKRPEMFTDKCLTVVFGNIEELYTFSMKFLKDLESQYNTSAPHLSELGCSFLKHVSTM